MNQLEGIVIATLSGLILIIPTCQQASAHNKPFANDAQSRYDKHLSKNVSDLPSRSKLAFFVPDVCPASQAGRYDSTPQIHSLASHTLMGNTVYDGLTLQNKRALGRICRAVTNVTESKTRHPIPMVYITLDSVTLTQKTLGGSYHG